MQRFSIEDIDTTVTTGSAFIQIGQAIRSKIPACLKHAPPNGIHPFTCKNCYSHSRYLKMKSKKQENAALKNIENRYGKKGMRHDYLNSEELQHALKRESKMNERMTKSLTSLRKRSSWEDMLLGAVHSDNHRKFILDIIHLTQEKTDNFRLEIIKNLASKLRRGRNHKFSQLLLDLSVLFRNLLGRSSHEIISDILGFPSNSTVDRVKGKGMKCGPGFIGKAFDQALDSYDGLIVAAHDEARSLRMLQPYLCQQNNEVILIGDAWCPSSSQWPTSLDLVIPRKGKDDPDDFTAIKRMVEDKIPSLSRQVSIHNFHCVTSKIKSPIVFCTWPVPNSGYRGVHVLDMWQEVRKRCCFDETGQKREKPLPLAYFASDSSSHSLNAAITMMRPNRHHTTHGIQYLGLPLEDQAYYAPYYWEYPSIYVPDPEHLLRLFLRCLKYDTRDLIFFKQKDHMLCASIQHFLELRNKLGKDEVNLSLQDLIVIKYCDQNTQGADKVFNEKNCEYLVTNIPHSEATALFVKAVCFLMKPYRTAFLNCQEVVQFSSAGIYILRYWRKYLEITGHKLHSHPGAKSIREKRGNFLTSQCYASAELLHSASICHLLALHRHCPDKLNEWASPIQAGTDTTERLISEMQGKTCQLQSLDSQPTYGDILQRISIVQQNQLVEDQLVQIGGKRRVQNRRRRNMGVQQMERMESQAEDLSIHSYAQFCDILKSHHRLGIERAQRCIEQYLPADFAKVLKDADAWQCPYKFPKPHGFSLAGPTNFMSPNLNINFAELDIVDTVHNSEQSLHEDTECHPPSLIENSSSTDDDHDLEPHSEDLDVNEEQTESERWLFSKLEDGKEKQYNIRQILKFLIPREYVSRERSRRFIAAPYLPGLEPIPKDHSVMLFRTYLVSFKQDVKALTIFNLETECGKQVSSAPCDGKHKFRGRLYTNVHDHFFISECTISSWLSTKRLLFEVDIIHDDKEEVHTLSPESMDICARQKIVFNKNKILQKSSLVPAVETKNALEEDFYKVEDIVEKRITKAHETEYLVKFEGYSEKYNQWLPDGAFSMPVSFTLTSKSGRRVKSKTKQDSMWQEPAKRKRKSDAEAIIPRPLPSKHSQNDFPTCPASGIHVMGIHILEEDFMTLSGDEEVMDNIITAYLKLKARGSTALVLDSTIFQTWRKGCDTMSKTTFSSYDKIIAPFNPSFLPGGQKHWMLFYADVEEGALSMLDSMFPGKHSTLHKEQFGYFIKMWNRRVKKQREPLINWQEKTVKCGRQLSGNGCGIFCMMFGKALIAGDDPSSIRHEQIQEERTNIALELLTEASTSQ